jgi:oligo-1,6-glucosidase
VVDLPRSLSWDPQIWAYTRATPSQRLLVIANCGRGPWTVQIGKDWNGAELVLGNVSDAPVTLELRSLDLAGWEARVYLA